MEYSLKFSHPEKGLVTVVRDGKDWLCMESCTANDDILNALIKKIKDLEAKLAEAEVEALKK